LTLAVLTVPEAGQFLSIPCLLKKKVKNYGFLTEFGKFAMGKKDKEKKKGKGAAKTAEKTEKKQKTKVKKELAAKGKNCELNINKLRLLRVNVSSVSTKNLTARLLRINVAAFFS
jgi:hypothetical protein